MGALARVSAEWDDALLPPLQPQPAEAEAAEAAAEQMEPAEPSDAAEHAPPPSQEELQKAMVDAILSSALAELRLEASGEGDRTVRASGEEVAKRMEAWTERGVGERAAREGA